MKRYRNRNLRNRKSNAVFVMQTGLCVGVLAAVLFLKLVRPEAYPAFSEGYDGQMETHLTLEDLNRTLEQLIRGEKTFEELLRPQQAVPVFGERETQEKSESIGEDSTAGTKQSWVFLDVDTDASPAFSSLSAETPFEVSEFEPSMIITDEEIDEPALGALAWPAQGPVSSPFGYRIHPLTKKRSFHTGIDIAASGGSDIVSAAAGKIWETGYNEVYGNYMLIKHSDSFYTFYGHCRKLIKEEGERVGKGEAVALVGTTGWSTGNHLHFEVRYRGEQIDPQQFY